MYTKYMNMIEISLTKDMASKMNIKLDKTKNNEPDINHWYAKVLIVNRKRYVFATNTMTRFALFFRMNTKTLFKDFKFNLEAELRKYNLSDPFLNDKDIFLSLGDSKKSTGQLNSVEMDYKYFLFDSDFSFKDKTDYLYYFNKNNLGKAGNSKDYVFAVDEMRKYYSKLV